MNVQPSFTLRRTVLGIALALALAVSGAWQPDIAVAQSAPAAPLPSTAAQTPSATPNSAATADADDPPAIVVEKDGKRVRITGGHRTTDPDMEEFNRFLQNQPEFAGMVVAVVAIIFLSPVFIVGLVISYRMRKARLLHQTMLSLAERGVVPPAQAMQALSAGQLPPSVTEPVMTASGAAAAPSLLEQARAMRSRAASSDLRKAILVGAVGLAFTVRELWRAGRPGTVGLILLFIGVGYGILWWYETRQMAPGGTARAPGTGT